MAFNTGGIVPGYENTDTVPAMLTSGETVLPKSLSEGLINASKTGDLGGDGTHYHAPIHYAPVIQAVDSAGVQRILDKHGETFQRHVKNILREINKG